MYGDICRNVRNLIGYVKSQMVDHHSVYREVSSHLVTNDHTSGECGQFEVREQDFSFPTELMEQCHASMDVFATRHMFFCVAIYSSCQDKTAQRSWAQISLPGARSDCRISWAAASLPSRPVWLATHQNTADVLRFVAGLHTDRVIVSAAIETVEVTQGVRVKVT
jgi:hypothetical protein